MTSLILLFFAGLVAGAMNAVAGGGSFVTFPALIYAGVPSVAANASSTVALLPGSIASAWKLRTLIKPFPYVHMGVMVGVTLLGGCTGALLLLYTPAAGFDALVPWLLLTGSLAFAFGRQFGDWLRRFVRIGPVLMISGQFVLGIYGGYFGGAVGIMMMAFWMLCGLSDIRMVNANKTLFVGIANSIAVVLFICYGKVVWLPTCVMMVATVIGGYSGAVLTRVVSAGTLRVGIVCLNFGITIAFFIKTYA